MKVLQRVIEARLDIGQYAWWWLKLECGHHVTRKAVRKGWYLVELPLTRAKCRVCCGVKL